MVLPKYLLIIGLLIIGSSTTAAPLLPANCRSLLMSADNPEFLPKAATFMKPLLGHQVLVELTTEELSNIPEDMKAQLISTPGAVLKAKLVDYNTATTLPQITIKVGRKSYTLSAFIKADSSEVLGLQSLEKWTTGEQLSNIYRLRDIQLAEEVFESASLEQLKTEIDAIINSLAHEEDLLRITEGRRGWRVMQRLAGVYGERTWIDREMMKADLARYVRDGNISDAAGKFQSLFTRVETATIVLLRLRPLYDGLDRLQQEQPELAKEIDAAKKEAALVMDKHAQILGWEYGDYRALRAELDRLIASQNKTTSEGATDLQNEVTKNTYEGVQSLLTRLGIYRISQSHFPLLFRNEINLDARSAVDWVTKAYYGEPSPGLNKPPYAMMLPRRATVHRYAFDQMVSAMMNAVTHPALLNFLLKPIDAIPSHPGLQNNIFKRVTAFLGHLPHEYLNWIVEFLRDRRSRYIHGPSLLVIKTQMGTNESSLDDLRAFMNETARHGKGANAFLVTAARDPEFSTGPWINLRSYLNARVKEPTTKTELLVQFQKDMQEAEIQAAKLGPLSSHPVSGIDFIMKSGGTFVAFQAAKTGYEWLNSLGILPTF